MNRHKSTTISALSYPNFPEFQVPIFLLSPNFPYITYFIALIGFFKTSVLDFFSPGQV